MKSWLLLCLLLVLGTCGSVLAADKAIGLQPAGLATTTEGGQKWALVVGINEYSNVPALRYASADAKGLYNALIKAGFPADNIMLMTDTATGHLNPTRGNLRARINQIATLVEKEDVLLVFFSGHGTEKNGEGYLVPIDGSTTDIGSLIPLSWVKKTLETSPAKHRLLILDACRAGSATVFSFGNSESSLGDYGWYSSNSGSKTHPVGQKKPNAFGLYDMHGNAYEWCQDWYDENYYANSPSVDPQALVSGKRGRGVLRGGSWLDRVERCRSAERRDNPPGGAGNDFGFRVVVVP